MVTIKTIDLWTEQLENHLDCFKGAFIDGFDNGVIPFDSYKVIRNCNCIIITSEQNLNISNKHNAIIFYKGRIPVRLMVINQLTDMNKCIEVALSQPINGVLLKDVFGFLGIRRIDVDLREKPLFNGSNHEKEIDVGSCDRPSLLNSMLEGCYTESDTNFGKNNSDNNYRFMPNIDIQYELIIGDQRFAISHQCAFINENMTRIIPLQDDSFLDIEMIRGLYAKDGNGISR